MDPSAPRRSGRASSRSYNEQYPLDKVFTPYIDSDSHDTAYQPTSPMSSPPSPGDSIDYTPVKTAKSRNKRKVQETSFDVDVPVSIKKKEYYDKGVQADKPEPFGAPPVHSEIRQSLCESVKYFRAYQSGAYTKDRMVVGFLCDKEASIRAKFTPEVMIATTGGGKFQDENGKMIQGKDNTGNNASRSFMNTLNARTPVAVIGGQGNPISPSKLPHYYCVLDWFHVTDVWCEMSAENTQNGLPFMRWMCRLEKIDLATTSWWAPKGSLSPPPAADFVTKAAVFECSTCEKTSKQIYDAGWACLNPECEDFFAFAMKIDHQTLNINPAFINERNQYTGATPGPLIPNVPSLGSSTSQQVTQATSDFAKAIVCPKCHGCIQKVLWNGWVCDTDGCDYELELPCPPISVADALLSNTKVPKTICFDAIKHVTATLGRYEADIYQLSGPDDLPCGFIFHLKGNDFINSQPGGPDDLFEEMQSTDLKLKRGVIKGKDGGVTQMLTAHYAANWGAPYKWHVKHKSVGFADTPLPILRVLNRLTWAGEQVTEYDDAKDVGGNYLPPNEVLSVGYKSEDGKMTWHDDGEKELGPTVSSLSLGCSATMAWRQKTKEFGDRRPGKKGKPLAKSGRLGNGAILKVVLNHGDIMVMHGSLVQKYYEHEVIPLGKLRFAITARRVKNDMLDPAQRAAALAAGTVPELEFPPYNGDVDEDPASQHSQDPEHDDVSDVKSFVDAQDDAQVEDNDGVDYLAGSHDAVELLYHAIANDIDEYPVAQAQKDGTWAYNDDLPDYDVFADADDSRDLIPAAYHPVSQGANYVNPAHLSYAAPSALALPPRSEGLNFDFILDQVTDGQVDRAEALRAAMDLVAGLQSPLP